MMCMQITLADGLNLYPVPKVVPVALCTVDCCEVIYFLKMRAICTTFTWRGVIVPFSPAYSCSSYQIRNRLKQASLNKVG
jgi:hypothetical protein